MSNHPCDCLLTRILGLGLQGGAQWARIWPKHPFFQFVWAKLKKCMFRPNPCPFWPSTDLCDWWVTNFTVSDWFWHREGIIWEGSLLTFRHLPNPIKKCRILVYTGYTAKWHSRSFICWQSRYFASTEPFKRSLGPPAGQKSQKVWKRAILMFYPILGGKWMKLQKIFFSKSSFSLGPLVVLVKENHWTTHSRAGASWSLLRQKRAVSALNLK